MGLYWPTISQVISDGGTYLYDRGPFHSPRFHQGCDISIPTGIPIYASGDGVVTALPNTGNLAGYGRYAQVQYGDVQVRTAHLITFSAGLSVGQRVNAETLLGLSGGAHGADGSGDSTGPHCHLEVHVNGVLADPFSQLASRSTIAATSGTLLAPDAAPVTPYHARPYAKRKKPQMIAYILKDGNGTLGPVGATRSYLIGGGYFLDTTGDSTANAESVVVNGYDSTGAVMDSPNLTYAELYKRALASGACAPAVLAQIKTAAGL